MNKTAIANFGGTANTITGKPKEPSPPPKPDLEIATKKNCQNCNRQYYTNFTNG